jgi:hypothetical protein
VGKSVKMWIKYIRCEKIDKKLSFRIVKLITTNTTEKIEVFRGKNRKKSCINLGEIKYGYHTL